MLIPSGSCRLFLWRDPPKPPIKLAANRRLDTVLKKQRDSLFVDPDVVDITFRDPAGKFTEPGVPLTERIMDLKASEGRRRQRRTVSPPPARCREISRHGELVLPVACLAGEWTCGSTTNESDGTDVTRRPLLNTRLLSTGSVRPRLN
jgi:hypothetical protein